jgi:hypothetical protein
MIPDSVLREFVREHIATRANSRRLSQAMEDIFSRSTFDEMEQEGYLRFVNGYWYFTTKFTAWVFADEKQSRNGDGKS